MSRAQGKEYWRLAGTLGIIATVVLGSLAYCIGTIVLFFYGFWILGGIAVLLIVLALVFGLPLLFLALFPGDR